MNCKSIAQNGMVVTSLVSVEISAGIVQTAIH